MTFDIYELGLLLAVTTAVALVCERLRLPYTIGLMLAGLALSMLPFKIELSLSKDLVYTFLLPPLVFEAALRLNWPRLRRDLPVILMLAGPGLMASAVLLAAGMHWIVGWSWAAAGLFGALISATDPVAVIATFDEARVRGRVDLLVRAESLINDGTAATAFAILLGLALGTPTASLDVTWTLLLTVGGGLACGFAVAGALLILVGRTNNNLVKITLTTLCGYGSFLLAQRIDASGVLAALAAGLVVAEGSRRGLFGSGGQGAVAAFWEYVAFLVNSVIFILIGLREGERHYLLVFWPAFTAILLAVVGRAIAVYPFCALFRRTRYAVEVRHQHVLFWGGFRGALPLALALGLPASIIERDQLVTVTFAVVAFSIVVQTLVMVPLLYRLGVIRRPSDRDAVGV
ncbi:MAG: cation:proton antiporter [Methylocystis sp.]|uniref:cation:proton antiporter n=1 Tax=Methylocystis sp. TaxID=1911079 RepID=UPI003DA3A591